jgi:ABC-2 type transport system ATP-binding protein
MTNQCIVVSSLTKNFGKIKVFHNADVTIEENTITALSGKNSSGKTTFLKLLSGFLLPCNGKIFVYNHNITQNRVFVKKVVSLVLNTEYGFYPQLTLKENLIFFCKIYNKPFTELYPFIDKLNLNNFLDIPFSISSSGIKTRLWLLSSLIKNPKIILIDELTKSVDYESKQIVYELIKEIKTKFGCTILFVSHNINEITSLCDHWIKIEDHKFVVIK